MANPFAALFNAPKTDVTLFALEPGQSTEGLRLSTRRVDLSERPSYECISYNRLPSASKSWIKIDDIKVSVPATLTSAFNALRRKDRPRLLWAQTLSALHRHGDAPPLQAAEAKSILKHADKAIFWMEIKGLRNPARVFGMMKELAKHYATVLEITSFPLRLSQASRQQMQAMLDYFTNIPKEPFHAQDEALWSDISSAFSQQYWNDLATLPEVVLPNHVVITEGKVSMSWKDFSNSQMAAVNLTRFLPHYKVDTTLWSTLDYITRTRVRCAEDTGVELLPVLQSTKQMTCADPRDHIFALLPLVIPSPRVAASERVAQMPPNLDYSSTTQEIYIAAAQYMIAERQDFCIWWAEYSPMHRIIPNMPSWVPDFHHSPETATPAHLAMCNPSHEKWTFHLQHTGKAKLITVSPTEGIVAQAHILDYIRWVSPIVDPHANKAAHTSPFWVADNVVSQMMEAFKDSKTLEEIFNCVFTTLILHHVTRLWEIDQHQITQTLPESFKSFLAEAALYRNFAHMANTVMSDAMTGNTRDWSQLHQDSRFASRISQVGKGEEYLDLMKTRAAGRRFFMTEKGHIGMSAVELRSDSSSSNEGTKEGIMVGDTVAFLVGGFFPYVFREVGPQRFEFRGEAYVNGAMELDYFKKPDGSWREDMDLIDIRIV